MNRRTFLKVAGMGSLSFAAGCSKPEKHLYSLVKAPDDMVQGNGTLYASTCRECPAGCGILAKNREGRVVKIEGNPLHPINRGKLCMRGQAALQGVYHPDRIKTPMLKENGQWRAITFPQAEILIKNRTDAAAAKGSNRIRMLTEVVGDTLLSIFNDALRQWRSPEVLIFEPFAYESLKRANKEIFGINGLVSYRIDKADLLVSFGADFLETWLSPVEYARQFKQMHAYSDGQKGFFFCVSPYQSLTGANSDLWLPCTPGGEAIIVLGLIREVLRTGRDKNLNENIRKKIEQFSSFYTRETVVKLAGASSERFDQLASHLIQAKRPLVLGTGTGGGGENGFHTDLAVNLLNLVLDPDLPTIDLGSRHRVEIAAEHAQVLDFFTKLQKDPADVVFFNNVNPVYALPSASGLREAISQPEQFTIAFANFMDETAESADLVVPVKLPLETWDEYAGKHHLISTLQPAMGKLTGAPDLGGLFLRTALYSQKTSLNYKVAVFDQLHNGNGLKGEAEWVQAIQHGGIFKPPAPDTLKTITAPKLELLNRFAQSMQSISKSVSQDMVFIAAPSIRFFDGRGANKPWLNEVPDPLSKVAWQSPVLVHPQTCEALNIEQGDVVRIESQWGRLDAPVYESDNVKAGVIVMGIGQGHSGYGRYARNFGSNPLDLLSSATVPVSGGRRLWTDSVKIQNTGQHQELASTYGSRIQHGRKIALHITTEALAQPKPAKPSGLGMWDFPLTLPLPEGYDPSRDFYPPIEYDDYRWAMTVDLDRCVGCGACAAACYAENNIGIVGEERVIEGREMAWLQVERYLDPDDMEKVVFLPMMCQQCDNAPCESVCPVYAPHHSKEGLNNQIYNRCIGTRFCSQNCPYKVRRFNWFEWKWPSPINLQLNPDVTVRSKGVMEKCSFCIQRIKTARNVAKNERRLIRDGEVIPACVQTCPTDALIFGNLMDTASRVRQMVADPRAYQVMGYINTKPAVIYLKKVRHVI